MRPPEEPPKTRRFLADAPAVIAFALPYIIGGGLIGAWVGNTLGGTANGFRVGVILGGAVAFLRLRRRAKGRPERGPG